MSTDSFSLSLDFGQSPDRPYVVGSQSFQSSVSMEKVGDQYWDELTISMDLDMPTWELPVQNFVQRVCPAVLDDLMAEEFSDEEDTADE